MTDTKLTAVPIKKTEPFEPDPFLIDTIQELLDAAKTGKLTALIGCYLDDEGDRLDYHYYEADDIHALYCALGVLQFNFMIEHFIDND
jgi:hypothetical protein